MSSLIEEKDVTAIRLSVELEHAVIQHVLDEDKSIYVNEDAWFPFWIRIQERDGYVSLNTYTNFRKSTNHLQRLELCNELNARNYLVTACVKDDQLLFDYILNYRDGLLRETFIRSCRQFARNLDRGLNLVDPESDFVLPPGRTEEQDA